MKAFTHLNTGTLAILPFLSLQNPISLLGLAGAAFPDIDLLFKKRHKKRYKEVTHNLFSLILTSLFISRISEVMAIAWFLSYSTHLILDSFTADGIPLLYPILKVPFGLRICTSGKCADHIIGFISLIFNLLIMTQMIAF